MSVLIEVDETLIPQIDELAAHSKKSRYDLINEILRKGLRKKTREEKDREFRESYERFPITQQEIDEQREWEEIQDWGEE